MQQIFAKLKKSERIGSGTDGRLIALHISGHGLTQLARM